MVVAVLRQSFLIAPGLIDHRARFHRSSRRSLRQFVVLLVFVVGRYLLGYRVVVRRSCLRWALTNCGIFGVVVCAGIRRLGCVLSDYEVRTQASI